MRNYINGSDYIAPDGNSKVISLSDKHATTAFNLFLQTGDTEIFNALYTDMRRYCEAKAMKLVKDPNIAYDLVHDFFLKLLIKVGSGIVIDNPKSWLSKCIKHACLNYLKKKDTQIMHEMPEGYDIGYPPTHDSDHDLPIVQTAIDQSLAPRPHVHNTYRDTLAGCSTAAIMHVYGRTRSNVYTDRDRAHKVIRSLLPHYGYFATKKAS